MSSLQVLDNDNLSDSSDSDSDGDDLLTFEPPLSLSQMSSAHDGNAANRGGADNDCGDDGIGGNVGNSDGDNSDAEEDIDPAEIIERARKRVSLFDPPSCLTTPSDLYWHKVRGKKGKRKGTIKRGYIPYPCREAHPDEARGIIDARWDATCKVLVQYFAYSTCSMGEFSVISRNQLVPYCGEGKNEEDKQQVIGATGAGACPSWCPKLKEEYLASSRRKDDSPIDVQAHLLFLDLCLEESASKESAATEEVTRAWDENQNRAKVDGDGSIGDLLDSNSRTREEEDPESDGDDEEGSAPRRKKDVLRPGDLLEYYHHVYVAGDTRALRTGTVLSVDPRRDPVIVLDSGDHIPNDARVKRLKRMVRGKLQDCQQGFCQVTDFRLSKAALRGQEGLAAGLKKEMKRTGEIVKRNMDKLRDDLKKDEFAPFDMLNKIGKGSIVVPRKGDTPPLSSPRDKGDDLSTQVTVAFEAEAPRTRDLKRRRVESGCLPIAPKSRWDLKKSALAYTAPFSGAKSISMSFRLIPRLSRKIIIDMLEANGDDETSVGRCIELLPRGVFNKDDKEDRAIICHLYRNFYGEIELLRKNKRHDVVPVSDRERDIFVFCIASGRAGDLHKFMPYRANTFDCIHDEVVKMGLHENAEHAAHVKKTVGSLLLD